MEDPGAELDDVVRSPLAPAADDCGRMSSRISFRMTAPCDMLRKEENLALMARAYPQCQLERAVGNRSPGRADMAENARRLVRSPGRVDGAGRA